MVVRACRPFKPFKCFDSAPADNICRCSSYADLSLDLCPGAIEGRPVWVKWLAKTVQGIGFSQRKAGFRLTCLCLFLQRLVGLPTADSVGLHLKREDEGDVHSDMVAQNSQAF